MPPKQVMKYLYRTLLLPWVLRACDGGTTQGTPRWQLIAAAQQGSVYSTLTLWMMPSAVCEDRVQAYMQLVCGRCTVCCWYVLMSELLSALQAGRAVSAPNMSPLSSSLSGAVQSATASLGISEPLLRACFQACIASLHLCMQLRKSPQMLLAAKHGLVCYCAREPSCSAYCKLVFWPAVQLPHLGSLPKPTGWADPCHRCTSSTAAK